MVDVLASSNLDLGGGPVSTHDSGTSSPLRGDVPPIAHGDDFFLSTVAGSRPTELSGDGAAFFKGQVDTETADSDIYRGERPPTPIPRLLEADEVSVASSSSSLNVGRRFGALAYVVEAAIARWAKTHSSASSSSSSSSSSVSSTTRTHTTRRRRGRRYSSTASVHNAAHERAILARKKAQEEFRIVPREFTLLLPSDSVPGRAQPSEKVSEQAKERRTIRTTSMPLILAQLDSAFKKSAKSRRTQGRLASSDAAASRITNKGKGKKSAIDESSSVPKGLSASTPSKATGRIIPQKSWWLDVASPSWDDLRSIGRLLHLHPLTLEDILHRDPREKLELFPGLGYYFIVFRALEGEHSRERFHRCKTQDSEGADSFPISSGDEGVIGAVNVYLVVFSEGICSFHFEDISEHTDKLRNKVLHMEYAFDMTPDWIAHGLMDSIVDAFFPILISIEKEVKEVDSLVLGISPGLDTIESTKNEVIAVGPADGGSSTNRAAREKSFEPPDMSTNEKTSFAKEGASLLPLSIRISESQFTLLRHIKSAIRNLLWRRKVSKTIEKEQWMTSTSRTLLRIAATRRIVTSLGRLLGTKGEVVSQIRKRLTLASIEVNNAGLGLNSPGEGEVAIYMGDIQDHIVTLQQSLNHYERVLSHSHPAYLSQLQVSQSAARNGSDKSILLLSVVSISVASIQVLLGLFSINSGEVPNNVNSVNHPFTVFFIVLSLSVFIGFIVVALVRYWHIRAKKKYSRDSRWTRN